jgi:DNA polymerase
VGDERGQVLEPDQRAVPGLASVVLTSHPSSVLRLRERSERHAAIDDLVADLHVASELTGA